MSGNIRANTDCRLNMGRLPWGYGLFVGYMDEVRIWNIAITEEQIQQQMASSSIIEDNNCVSYWSFNENTGTTITDAKGTANGIFYSALIDVHSNSDFANKIIRDGDRAFSTGAWNGKALYTVAGAGVDETNNIVSNNGNEFVLNYGFGGTAPDNRTTPITDGNNNMTWFGVLDPTETSQWITSDIPLPVELVFFTANNKDQKIVLKWQTATEINNYGFEIERKLLGTEVKDNTWQKVGFVKGNGTTYMPQEYTFVDESVTSGKVKYRLKQIDNDGTFKYSNEIEVDVNTPKDFVLYQDYPNPFNPVTVISYYIPSDGIVKLNVYDILGREVAKIVDEYQQAGFKKVLFDGSSLSSGIYFYKIKVGNITQVKSMSIVK